MKQLYTIVCGLFLAIIANAQEADTTSLNACRPEFSFRANAMFGDCSLVLTGGVRFPFNTVLGLGVSVGQVLMPYTIDQRLTGFLYIRNYIPLGQKKRFSLYNDFMGGGLYYYKWDEHREDTESRRRWYWWCSWQPGIAIRIWNRAQFFFGPSIGPTIGLHAGISI